MSPPPPAGAQALADPPDYERMEAYFYGFDPTGVEEIDRILSAVAWAGKAQHHTQNWVEEAYSNGTPVEWIQKAANDAAQALRALADMRGALGFDTKADAHDNLLGAREDLSNSNGNDALTRKTIDRVLKQLADARQALARSAP